MFQFPPFPSPCLCVQHGDARAFPLAGFPIRKSPDITPAHGSPRLIAVYHVLHRLLAPRHPPYALSSLTSVIRRNRSSLIFCSIVKVQLALVASGWATRPTHQLPTVKKRGLTFASGLSEANPTHYATYVSLSRLCVSVALKITTPQGFARCGDEGIRTPNLLRAKEALSQLSYIPFQWA